jgi:hypothetical protein
VNPSSARRLPVPINGMQLNRPSLTVNTFAGGSRGI